MNFVTSVEERFPVDHWSVDGIQIWPVVRNALGFGAWSAISRERPHPSPKSGPGITRVKALAQVASGAAHRTKAIAKDRPNQAARRRSDALFLADGVSRVWLGDAWYERYCEPLMGHLIEKGHTSTLLEPQHAYRVPRRAQSYFVQTPIEIQWLRSAMRRSRSTVELDEYEGFLNQVEAVGLDTTPVAIAALVNEVQRIDVAARYLHAWIEGTQPRLCFSVDYYNTIGMAFNLACRRLSIPAVEIQHGGQGPFHFAYAEWRRVPDTGYELLPDVFWVWTPADAAAIEAWSSSTSHRAMVGGDAWLDLWLRSDSDLVTYFDRVVGDLLEDGGKPTILISLSTARGEKEHLAPILEARRTAPTDWRWLARLHPATPHDEQRRVIELLAEEGWNADELARTRKLPLPALLRHTDVHITYGSTACFDAAKMRVPSIVTSSEGVEIVTLMEPDGAGSSSIPPFVTPAFDATSIKEAVEYICRQDRREWGQMGDPSNALDLLLARYSS